MLRELVSCGLRAAGLGLVAGCFFGPAIGFTVYTTVFVMLTTAPTTDND